MRGRREREEVQTCVGGAREKKWACAERVCARALTIGWYCSIAVSSAAASCVSFSSASTGSAIAALPARLCAWKISQAIEMMSVRSLLLLTTVLLAQRADAAFLKGPASLATSARAARSTDVALLAKKTAWSIGKERKRGKKSTKVTAASTRGNTDAKGFQVTKEKLAKTLGEMSVADALKYLSGPEPGKAGISDSVVEGLKQEIEDAVAAAKAEAEKDDAEAASGQAAMTGPEDDSEEAMRRWRAYCAEALAAAEDVEAGVAPAPASPPPPTSLDAVPKSDVPLFKKPREEGTSEYAPAQEMF